MIAPNMSVTTDYRVGHIATAPKPYAVNRRLAARFAQLIKRMLVQQHLYLIEEAAPEVVVLTGWQQFVDAFISNFAKRMGFCWRNFRCTYIPAIGPKRQENDFLTVYGKVPIQQ